MAPEAGGLKNAVCCGCSGPALILALTRQIHLARDNQTAATWRPMIGDRARREDELGGNFVR